MRISLMGKGGSGKTTVASGLIQYLTKERQPVVAIDGDVNAHMAGALNMANSPLEPHMEQVKTWLEPVSSKTSPVIGVTPPSADSRFIRVADDDPFLNEFATWNDDRSVALLTVGGYEKEHVGKECYHGMLQVAELALHRLLDAPTDWVIVDSTAGVDSMGTSLYFTSDLNLFVVEPTAKSVGVFEDFRRVAADFGVNTLAVANKVHDDGDRTFLEDRLGDAIIGVGAFSPVIRRMEQGDDSALNDYVADNEVLWKSILSACPAERDWDAYMRRLRDSYIDSCKSWYNDYYGRQLDKELDTSFSYSSVARTV